MDSRFRGNDVFLNASAKVLFTDKLLKTARVPEHRFHGAFMRFASLDTFILEEEFWQDKMGRPVANEEFFRALLRYGDFEDYRFYCDDAPHLNRVRAALERRFSREEAARVGLSLKGFFLEEVKRRSPGIMHHGDFTYYVPPLMEIRNRLDTPFAVTGITHSLDGAWMQSRLIQILLAGPQPFDAVVCTGRCAREYLQKGFEDIRKNFREAFGGELPEPPLTALIPLGVSDRAFEIRDKGACRREAGIPPERFVILSVARFSPRHKADLTPVLELLQLMRREKALPEFLLVLAGGGREGDLRFVREVVERLGLADIVRIEANIPAERKWTLYGAADIFLSMVDNYQETYGITIVEAMAQGLPVIASDFNGYKDLVEHGRTGFLIPVAASGSMEPWNGLAGILDPSLLRFHLAQKVFFEADALWDALVATAGNPRLRRDMGIRGRTGAMRRLWSAVIPLYEDLWRELDERMGRVVANGWEKSRRPSLLVPDFGHVFSHYPSGKFGGNDCLRLGTYGKKRMSEGFRPTTYENVDVMLNPECRDFVDERLGGGRHSIEDTVETACARFGFSPERVMLHLDARLKHGYGAFPSNFWKYGK